MKKKTLRKMRYNQSISKAYKAAMDKIIKEAGESANYWATAQYNDNMSKGRTIKEAAERIAALKSDWVTNFSDVSFTVASRFAHSVDKSTKKAINSSLSESGIAKVKFAMTPAMKEAIDGVVAENVSLIKSIPEQYFTQVENIAIESITRGRDLNYMTTELQKQLGVTKRRAERIALDQNNKATAKLTKIRDEEMGITKGIWIHSGGGSNPRQKHVAANGKEFSLSKGLQVGDNGEWVLPGEEINCGCSWKPILPY